MVQQGGVQNIELKPLSLPPGTLLDSNIKDTMEAGRARILEIEYHSSSSLEGGGTACLTSDWQLQGCSDGSTANEFSKSVSGDAKDKVSNIAWDMAIPPRGRTDERAWTNLHDRLTANKSLQFSCGALSLVGRGSKRALDSSVVTVLCNVHSSTYI